MLAVVTWVCDCGTRVKTVYDSGGQTIIRCPQSGCEATRILHGGVKSVWTENSDGSWTPQSVASLLVP